MGFPELSLGQAAGGSRGGEGPEQAVLRMGLYPGEEKGKEEFVVLFYFAPEGSGELGQSSVGAGSCWVNVLIPEVCFSPPTPSPLAGAHPLADKVLLAN